MTTSANVDLSVVIPAKNEGPNIARVVGDVSAVCRRLGVTFEILVIDGYSRDDTREAATAAGAGVHTQEREGYGGALIEGFRRARGEFVATMDADLSHPPEFLETLWSERHSADLVIASRYIRGGRARMPAWRYILSKTLNAVFRIGLAIPVRDQSSGFRLYRADALNGMRFSGTDFNILQEILVRFLDARRPIKEVPFDYWPRAAGASNARVLAFGWSYLKTFGALLMRRFRVSRSDFPGK